MGASMGGGGNRRTARRGNRGGFSDVNVTPMLDVMLVLLIIFMVAAPMMTSGVNVDLPKAGGQPLAGQDEPLTVSIQADGKIFVQKTSVTITDLGSKLKAIIGEKKETRILVRGDKTVDYGRIMRVVGEISAAGFTKVALVTEPASSKEK